MTFALLGHPANFDHLAGLLHRQRPGLSLDRLSAHRESVARAFEWSATHAAGEPLCLPGGIEGRLIFCTFLPERLDNPRAMLGAVEKTRMGMRLAAEMGAKIVGLGGFTSIVAGAQGEGLAQEFSVATTSGNTLTAALALAQLDHLLERLGRKVDGRTVAVLGASGDIGRALGLALAPRAGRLILFARNRAKLESFRDDLPVNGAAIQIVGTAKEACEADIILAATSSPRPLLNEIDLRPGAIALDIGYPPNIARPPVPRDDVLAVSGGLARMPFGLDIVHYTRLPAPDIMYGCFAETMALALAGRHDSYSSGQGRIDLERMDEILRLALAHGFKPAPPYRGGRPLDHAALDSFLRAERLQAK